MKYFVIMPDGQKYGPADVTMLNQWVVEGRLTAQTMLQDEATGQTVMASQVPGINFGMGGPPMAGTVQPPMGGPSAYQQPPNPYPRGGGPMGAGYPGMMDNGDKDIKQAWIFGTLALLCCPIVFGVLGILRADSAKKKGHPQGQNAFIFCICTTVGGIIIGILLRTMQR